MSDLIRAKPKTMAEPVRILIVDDHPEDRTVYKRLLILDGTADYIFFEAETAKQALASIHDNAPDCILLNCELPDLGDLDLRTEFAESYPGKTPAVVMLGRDHHPAVRGLDDHVHDWLVKPELSGEELRRAVVAAIEKAGRRRLLNLREGALKRMAVIDELTGLYGRLYIQDQLEGEIYRAQRYDLPFCIAMIDLDHFKRIHDRYGRAVGDRILKEIGDLIKKSTRCLDIVSRIGDEKFLIMLPNTDLEQARILSERLRNKIKALKFNVTTEDSFHISCSIGLSEYDVSIESKDSLIQRANQALYEAKNQGRDCLWIWSENLSMAAANDL